MGRKQTYLIDNDYFSRPLTANMAYLMGLIYSDGGVSKKYGRLEYTCCVKDIVLPLFIKSQLCSTHPLRYRDNYVSYAISNKKLVTQMIDRFNMPDGNKSLNNLHIPQLPDDLYPDFLRGVVDGDGSIWWDGQSSYSFAICGSRDFILEIAEIITRETSVPLRLRYRYTTDNPRSCSVEAKGNGNMLEIYNYLYNGGFSLPRKEKKFLDAIRLHNITTSRIKGFADRELEIVKLYNNGMRQFEIAKTLSCPHSSVRNIIQKNRVLGNCT